MKPLLSKSRLTRINRALYGRNVEAVFYKLTPADGEVEIGRITSGFTVNGRRKDGEYGESVNMRMAADAGIDREDLRVNATVALTINGQTLKYRIGELLSMQQLGSGYVLRLDPMKGATG